MGVRTKVLSTLGFSHLTRNSAQRGGVCTATELGNLKVSLPWKPRPKDLPLLQQGAEVQSPHIFMAVTVERGPHEASGELEGA